MADKDAPQFEDRLGFAVKIARLAGQQTLELFRSNKLEVDRKGDGSPVTTADREAEQLLRRMISETYPDDAIVGEEFGESPGTSGFCLGFGSDRRYQGLCIGRATLHDSRSRNVGK